MYCFVVSVLPQPAVSCTHCAGSYCAVTGHTIVSNITLEHHTLVLLQSGQRSFLKSLFARMEAPKMQRTATHTRHSWCVNAFVCPIYLLATLCWVSAATASTL